MSARTDYPSATSWDRVLLSLLRPIARFAIRHGLKVQQLESALQEVMLEEAHEQLRVEGQKDTASRLSIMTGIHRREIARRSSNPGGELPSSTLIAKVIGQWQLSKALREDSGSLRSLSIGSDDSEFNRLVRSVNRELNPATILFELERTGVVQIDREATPHRASLIKTAYAPSDRFQNGVELVSADIGDLLHTVEHNLTTVHDERGLHARTVFDNIRCDNDAELVRWIRTEGHEFHRKVREKLAEYDFDINPRPDVPQRRLRISVGSFSSCDEVSDDDH